MNVAPPVLFEGFQKRRYLWINIASNGLSHALRLVSIMFTIFVNSFPHILYATKTRLQQEIL